MELALGKRRYTLRTYLAPLHETSFLCPLHPKRRKYVRMEKDVEKDVTAKLSDDAGGR